jgi:hypothetical protein
MGLATGTFVLALFISVVVLTGAVLGAVFVVGHYHKLIALIDQSELVLCCIGNMCKSPLLNPGKQCPVPDDLLSMMKPKPDAA